MKITSAFRHCPRCASKGLIRVNYKSGEPYDVAICDCQAGAFWRYEGGEIVRQSLGLPPAHQVALLEHFDGDGVQPVTNSAAFIDAGKTARRAKL